MVDQPEFNSCPLRGVECLGKNCAWWNFIGEECCVATLGTLATIDIGGRDRTHE